MLDESVARQLDEITALGDQGRIRDAIRRLQEWTAIVERARLDNARATTLNRSVLEARDQLRGRLDAYLAKAYAVGLAEDGKVAAAHDEACRALYTAPTDLERARDLVERYQHAVSSSRRCGR
jgi:hypothetical protein